MDFSSSTKITNLVKNEEKSLFWWKKFRFVGPGALVAVGYIDPGNWATEIAGGSTSGYALLSIVLISSILAMHLQIMSARLGIATGRNLAELSREAWPRFIWPSWIIAELAIIFTDLAEVLGSAIALQLLFSIPLVVGVVLTVLDVFLLLLLQRWGMNLLTRLISSLLFIISCGFVYELALAQPVIADVRRGFIPRSNLILNPQLLFLSLGVLGATVMPHNLYLHSHLVVNAHANPNKLQAQSEASSNTVCSLLSAMLLNSALVVLAASVFHKAGHTEVADLNEAHFLISSQVFLSIQLPFAMISLLILTSDKERMGILVNNKWVKCFGWLCTLLIILANCLLFALLFFGNIESLNPILEGK